MSGCEVSQKIFKPPVPSFLQMANSQTAQSYSRQKRGLISTGMKTNSATSTPGPKKQQEKSKGTKKESDDLARQGWLRRCPENGICETMK